MKIANKLARLFGLTAIAISLGCASAYHDYSECRVNCRYCAPPPLPYSHYDECVCHSCAASEYLAATALPAVERSDTSGDAK